MADKSKPIHASLLKRFFVAIGVAAGGFLILITAQALFATLGESEAFTNPKRIPKTSGKGPPLKYLVMGDSTAAGQGADYAQGLASKTSAYLAKTYEVTMLNTAVSGAKVDAVLADQIPEAKKFKPDIVVISVGANDTVHLTSLNRVEASLIEIIDDLIKTNCNAKIIITGSPDMGTVPRFHPPLNWIATWHSKNVANAMKSIIDEKGLTYAPIFEEVGPQFKADPSLFSTDRYHPNERGYSVWAETLNKAIEDAQKNQKSHCK